MNKLMNFCGSNPYKSLSENEILAELSEDYGIFWACWVCIDVV